MDESRLRTSHVCYKSNAEDLRVIKYRDKFSNENVETAEVDFTSFLNTQLIRSPELCLVNVKFLLLTRYDEMFHATWVFDFTKRTRSAMSCHKSGKANSRAGVGAPINTVKVLFSDA